jgi:hypothetical protein
MPSLSVSRRSGYLPVPRQMITSATTANVDEIPSTAALATAARLSRDLYRLDPNDPTRRRLYLTTLLQAAKFRNGLDKPFNYLIDGRYRLSLWLLLSALDHSRGE